MTIEAVLAELTPPVSLAAPISRDERLARLEKARRLTRDLGAEALLINAGSSIDYFTGLRWGVSERLTALFLPVSGDPIIVCPYFERGSVLAGLQVEADLRLWQEDESPYALIGDAMRAKGLTKLAVDPSISFEMVHALGKQTGLSILEAGPVIRGCRLCKSPGELAIMQQAMDMTLAVHKATQKILREGITTAEVENFIEAAHRKMGASGNSFCIVQFGRGTAYPHGLPGVQALKENDLVLVDTGCFVQGYTSDITRTYSFGKPTDRQRQIWDIEKEAQAAAFARVAVGVPAEEVDAAVRRVLEKHGLGPEYKLPGTPHRTGHGIGLSIHEAPFIVRGDKTLLDVGMCFSDEPMIVVPGEDGTEFGVRLEDHIHVTEKGAAWFTQPQQDIFTA
ncbi:Xaa-Pro dipeptidase [Rhizomicrobium palustre]|uniref:Xaa-Pro dipeptidase n=1 Tax=Rhizomicrobium palustre TaxID=189966 RepID=A0A846N1L4_9PROT|nr:Xaa-Pro peptidase family protein [Rhizomicrobium palustre]NIK89493.1 Xaa-Pro dipeptidase [Rhizomicrobium palustre]